MPFTAEQFFEVFARYNEYVFPLPIILVLAAAAAVFLAIYQKAYLDQIIAGVLVFLWFWAGFVYHLTFFSEINSGAYLFGLGFVAQALLFFNEGIVKKKLRFRLAPDFNSLLGAGLIVYALVIYPLIGTMLGRVFPAAPTFGAPCPVVIYTFGMLVLTHRLFPLYLLIVPLLWSVVATTAAWHFGVTEDFGLPLAAGAALIFILRREFALDGEVIV